MSSARLVDFAGPVSLAAALLLLLTQIAGLLLGSAASAVAVANGLLVLLAVFLLLLGLIGLYAYQAEATGTFGLIAFIVALLGTMLVAGDYWLEAFAFPYLAERAPDLVRETPSGTLLGGAVISSTIFSVGYVLFGIASLRARVFPRGAAILLIVGAVVGWPMFPPFRVLFALAIGWLGYWLVRSGQRSKGLLKD